MNEIEAAWLAGYLEGEGSFTSIRVRSQCVTLQVTFSTVDEDVAQKAARLMSGVANGPYERHRNSLGKKKYWSVRTSGERAVAVIEAVQPHMGERRTNQILHALAIWKNRRAANREAGGPPACHPEKKHYSRGLCRSCHFKLFVHDLRKGVGEIPSQRPEEIAA